MASTVAVAVKRALIDRLAERFAGTGVQVSYHYPGDDPQRELIHAGRVEGTQDYSLMRATGNWPRDEELTFRLHVVVNKPGAEPHEVEERCVELGREAEDLIASDPTLDIAAQLGPTAQIIYVGVSAIDLDSDSDDDGAIGVYTLDIQIKSRIR